MESSRPSLHLVKPPSASPSVPATRHAETPSDDLLMLAASGGDTAAFAELVRRHEPTIRRVCRLILGTDEAARDAVQEVFLRAWRTRERFVVQARTRPFLLTIARNHCRDQLRRRRVRDAFRFRHPASQPLARSEVFSPEDRLLRGVTRTAVLTALEQLAPKFRVPLVMRFIDELDYDEIALVIGRTPSTARSRVHYGLKALHRALPEGLHDGR